MKTFAAVSLKDGTVNTLIQLHAHHSIWYFTSTYVEDTIQKTVHTRSEVWVNKRAEALIEMVNASDGYSCSFVEDRR